MHSSRRRRSQRRLSRVLVRSLEVLDLSLVLLRGLPCAKRTQVFTSAGFRVRFARIQTILSAFQFANHKLRNSNSRATNGLPAGDRDERTRIQTPSERPGARTSSPRRTRLGRDARAYFQKGQNCLKTGRSPQALPETFQKEVRFHAGFGALFQPVHEHSCPQWRIE